MMLVHARSVAFQFVCTWKSSESSIMSRRPVAEFSHRVSLLNERENLELKRKLAILEVGKKQCLRSCEVEILKVKQKAKKLHLNVLDYADRQKPSVRTKTQEMQMQSEGDLRVGGVSLQKVSPEKSGSFAGNSSSAEFGTTNHDGYFKLHENMKKRSVATRRGKSPNFRINQHSDKSFSDSSNARSQSASLHRRGNGARYSKPPETMVNNYVRNNSKRSENQSLSRTSLPSVDDMIRRQSSVSYNEMQSPYKVLHGIGKRAVSIIDDQTDLQSSSSKRRFMVMPQKRHSVSSYVRQTMYRPQTAPNRLDT